MAETILSNPDIQQVRVEGHTDSRGPDEYNMELSRRRARAVMRWLTSRDISEERLEAWGCGEVVPVESNDSAAGRQKNRRVEFHIVKPPPPDGVREPDGCVQID